MTAVYDSKDEPIRSREEYWQHLVNSSVFPQHFRSAEGPDFRGRIVTGDVGVFKIVQAISPSGECHRTPRHIEDSDPDLLAVTFLAHGNMVVDHYGRQTQIGTDDFFLVDSSRPFHHMRSASRLVVMTFPRATLPLPQGELAELAGAPLSGKRGLGALVSSLVHQLPRHMNDIGTVEGARLSSGVLDLLIAALAARLDRGDAVPLGTRQRVLLARIHAFIDERLADPELSPGMVAAAHHISVRHLYRLFEAQGATVAGWIRRRRLERCRRDLLDPALAARPVAAIGARWGFTDPAHFTRAFRTAYGLPPGEYRTLGNGSGPR